MSFYRIPITDNYKIHNTYHQQMQAIDDKTITNYVKDLKGKGLRNREGDVSFSFIKIIKINNQ